MPYPQRYLCLRDAFLLPAIFFGFDMSLPPGQVFLRESLEQKLEKRREEEVTRAAMVIRAHVLGYLAR